MFQCIDSVCGSWEVFRADYAAEEVLLTCDAIDLANRYLTYLEGIPVGMRSVVVG